ncbi:hypothetical protein JQK87_06710 [Streptomyces sp. G44]|uniref:hypothetical protein n=1 Tax=Streptomyces sp. G44 TaxID=2807632 RepID=UPI0019619D6F|nr:hypothetical protein [Streptomyces sp. G44]MBM7168106.1 hypothetical protein [Streptomyces sp. G44]
MALQDAYEVHRRRRGETGDPDMAVQGSYPMRTDLCGLSKTSGPLGAPGFNRETIRVLDALDLTASICEQIYHGNILRLMRLPGGDTCPGQGPEE